MKNLFFAASLAAMILPNAALGQQTQSEVNAKAEAEPDFVPLSTRRVGNVTASHMGGTGVIVYQGSGSVDILEVQPYFGIFIEDLNALAETCAEESRVASVAFNIRLETWRGAMEKAVIESVPDKFKYHGVNRLGVYQLVLKDSQTGRVLYRHKPVIEAKFPYLLNFNGSEEARISGKDTPCALVRAIVRTPLSRLVPQVIVPSSNATTEFETVTVAHELKEKLREELDKIETQEGLRRTENRTESSSNQSGGGFNRGFVSFGSVRQRLNSTNTTTREDTRRRYIDVEGMRNFIESSQTYIANRSYCIRTSENDCSKNPEHLSKMILEALQTERLTVLSEPPADNFRQAYVLIENDAAVNDAFSAGMKPIAKASQSTKMSCGEAVDLKKAARVAAAVKTGGASEAALAATARNQTNPPGNGTSGVCGDSRDMTISDENDVEWKFDGEEWVPTSMKVAYVSSANISRVFNTINEWTVSDGGISLGLMEIPLVLLDGQAVRQYNEMDARMKALEESATILDRINARIWRDVSKIRRLDREYKNPFPFPIEVAITTVGTPKDNPCGANLYVGGQLVGRSANNHGTYRKWCNVYATVPPRTSYKLESKDYKGRKGRIVLWQELSEKPR